ncbi:MAG: hypothetical protein KBS59_04330, partial [Clostridiales bacterium]|nr:hypothetical protein [Clostridiales bacterium]
AEIDRRYGTPLDFSPMRKSDENTFSVEYSDEKMKEIADTVNIPLCRAAMIEENVDNGQHVRDFKLYAHIPSRNPISDRKICVCRGETIGRKFICRFPAIRAPKFTLEILRSDGEPVIDNIQVFS